LAFLTSALRLLGETGSGLRTGGAVVVIFGSDCGAVVVGFGSDCQKLLRFMLFSVLSVLTVSDDWLGLTCCEPDLQMLDFLFCFVSMGL
jgi:hypothetical protein